MMRLIVRELDDIPRLYCELSDRIGHTRGVYPYATCGERCPLCGGGPSTQIAGREHEQYARRRFRMICVSCRKPWVGEPFSVLRRHLSGGSSYRATENGMAMLWDRVRKDWRIIAPMIEVRGRDVTQAHWDVGIISWILTLNPSVKSISNVVIEGLEHRPQFEAYWNARTVGNSIKLVKGVIRARATHRRTGILREVAA